MNLWPFIIAGVVTGAVYGLAGVGLVLTYKTSGIFNFAHGSVATVAAYIFYTLHEQHHVATPLAVAIALALSGPLLGLALERLGRSMTQSSLAVQVVGTVGLLILVEAAVTIIYGTVVSRTVPPFLGTGTVHLGSTVITVTQIVIFVVALGATVGLYAYFRFARRGLAMRAVVENPGLLDLAGTDPTASRRLAWMIGVTFASVSGILLAPLIGQLDPVTLTFLVVEAFGAAAIGSFTSLPLTFGGGLAIGIGSSLCTKYFHSGLASGLSSSLPFIVLLVVLVTARRGRLAQPPVRIYEQRSSWRMAGSSQLGLGLLLVVFLVAVPSFAGFQLDGWTTFLVDIVLFMSLGLLVRTSGQVSLCQVSFVAIGVASISHLVVGHHVPWVLALLLSGLIAVPVGALLAIPAIRLSGLYLALASFGFGILLQYMFYTQSYMFGSTGIGLNIPRPKVSWLNLSSDKAYYYFVLVIGVLIAVALVALNRSRLGRLLRALATNSTGLTASGASVNITQVLVFCLAAFIAAIAGALGGGVVGVVSADNYPPLLSLTYFLVIVITAGGEPWYAVLAAAGISLIPTYVHGANVTNYLDVAFGVVALLYALTPASARALPRSVTGAIDRLAAWVPRPTRGIVTVAPAVTSSTPISRAGDVPAPEPVVAGSGLRVNGLEVRFGGLVAVDGVDLEAPVGRITGLIGPNGAGKTTTFNACSGLNQPSAGFLEMAGQPMGRRGPAARARLGLGRTFQQTELADDLSVAENVALGREGGFAGYNPLRHIVGSRRQMREIGEAAAEAMEICGLVQLADTPVGLLSTGQRRLVELARCIAGPFRVLLLDEPSSGLDRAETREFGQILRLLVSERGLGILLVEHDMSLVSDVCDYIYVLDFGRPLFAGTRDEVLASPVVRAAYLGETIDGGDSYSQSGGRAEVLI
ncbi:ATP-binding cassette domain-containing protein [Acidiferrimicrobium sp. IK]|uniref:ABC transporter permease subunit n=1 Tax=Acidiferrimicrobium sp. IK TaxID=2871700 RepID=UPI0021CB8904|nr:ATP-binding cassette domain-containing protein [Acidiferrimicrobium sp. IK]MCU4186635.1 ATP-binding cassette domain-containing protein [Acidiferrimicrobium sp. IK]